jgi:hypothetical protein
MQAEGLSPSLKQAYSLHDGRSCLTMGLRRRRGDGRVYALARERCPVRFRFSKLRRRGGGETKPRRVHRLEKVPSPRPGFPPPAADGSPGAPADRNSVPPRGMHSARLAPDNAFATMPRISAHGHRVHDRADAGT